MGIIGNEANVLRRNLESEREMHRTLGNENFRLTRENTKLRELLLDIWSVVDACEWVPLVERQGKSGAYYEEDRSWNNEMAIRMRELGIEFGEHGLPKE